MIVVDTNVFVIDLRYPRDPLHGSNRSFLEALARRGTGLTTLVNLFEVVGILSFNLNAHQLRELVVHFPRRYGVRVVPELDLDADLPAVRQRALIDRMASRCSFGDALVLETAQVCARDCSHFVSWDAGHFAGRTSLTVATPEEMLARWPD